jgi:hypothetical protein
MKTKLSRKRAFFFIAIVFIFFTIFSIASKSPLHAGFWTDVNERLLLERLIGEGRFIGYQRNVDMKDPLFPIEVLNDGFKMISVYRDFPGSYVVEWTWRALLKNKSSRAVVITFEYKLQDKDDLFVASSKEYSKKIAAGETVIIEKSDYLPYETAKRVKNSNWYIHLQD